jgi:hypothetical protein
VSNVKTDETGFGGFVTMPLGIFAKLLGSNLKFVQLHFRILTKQHRGEIAMYRYLSCLIFLVATTTALAQTPSPAKAALAPLAPTSPGTTANHTNLIQTKSSSKRVAANAPLDSINLATTANV